MAKKQTNLRDIFCGEYIYVWADEELIYLSTPQVTINLTKEEWNYFKRDIDKLAEL